MRRSKLKMISLFLGILIVFVPGCSVAGGRSAKNGKEINIAVAASSATLDPQMVTDTFSAMMVDVYSGTLYRYDNNGELAPDLADSYEVSEDGLKWTYHVSPKAKWSNGEPVTADDFVFAMRRLADPETASPAIYFITTCCKIKNVDSVYGGSSDVSTLGVYALDDHTVCFELEERCPYFNSLIANPTFAPCNKDFFYSCNGHYCESGEYLLSSGAFTIDAYEPLAVQIKCTKNPDYVHSSEVKIDRVNFFSIANIQQGYMCLENGQIDITPVSGELLDMIGNDSRLHVVNGGTEYLKLNFRSDAMKNLNIRRALIKGMDRKSIVDNVLKNGCRPSTRIVTDGLYDGETTDQYNEQNKKFEELCGYDADEALKLWNQGLSELGVSKVEFTFAYNASLSNIVEVISDQWMKLFPGLKIEFKPLTSEQWKTSLRGGDQDIIITGWVPDYSDPSAYLDVMVTDATAAKTNYSDPHFDGLMEKSLDEADPKARNKILHDAEYYLAEQGAFVPLDFFGQTYIVSDKVKGFAVTPVGTILIVQDMSLEDVK